MNSFDFDVDDVETRRSGLPDDFEGTVVVVRDVELRRASLWRLDRDC